MGLLLLLGTVSVAAEETAVSGKITSESLDSVSPTVTVTDSTGKETVVHFDRYAVGVTLNSKAAQLGDLKVGQQVSISGCTMTPVGLTGKTVSADAAAAAASSSTAAASSTTAAYSPPAAATATASSPLRVLRSDKKPEQKK